jgi:hypothetical protein
MFKKCALLTAFIGIMVTVVTLAAALEGFMGIPWGANKEKVKSVLLAREGATLDPKATKGEYVVCDGGKFGGKRVEWITVLFAEDQMCKALVAIQPKEHEVINEFHEWVSALSEKYGPPSRKWEFFSSPYKDGDGYETTAIRVGKGTYAAAWEFPPQGGGEADSIFIEITDELFINISYENAKLMSRATEKKKAKDSKDL